MGIKNIGFLVCCFTPGLRKKIQPDHTYQMSGNQIGVHSLDLNKPFDDIVVHLNAIYDAHFS